MTARHPLFDFMPYGAPDLLSNADRRLLAAQSIASLILLLIVLALGAIIAAVPQQRLLPTVLLPPRDLIRFPEMLPELPPFVHRTPIARLPENPAVVIPVPEEPTLDPEVWLPPVVDAPAGPATGDAADAGAADALPCASCPIDGARASAVLPDRGIFVYHEEAPTAVHQVKPDYPELARDAWVEGRVLVHVLVGVDGRVVRAEVDEEYQIPLLNDVAHAAALKWVFTPALANDHPVAVWVSVPFDFRLR